MAMQAGTMAMTSPGPNGLTLRRKGPGFGSDQRTTTLRRRPRAHGPALVVRHARRVARARTGRGAGAPAVADRLSQCHLPEHDPDHRLGGAQLPRRTRFAPTLGGDAQDRRLPAGGADRDQGPGGTRRPARSRRGDQYAVVDQLQAWPRTADLPAIPPGAHAGG